MAAEAAFVIVAEMRGRATEAQWFAAGRTDPRRRARARGGRSRGYVRGFFPSSPHLTH